MRLPTLSLVIVIACGPGDYTTPPAGPPTGFPHAYAHRTCAPWDGAAVAMYLTPSPLVSGAQFPPAMAYVEITIWRGLDHLAGTVWTWPTTEQIGLVARCSAQSKCEQAMTARVRFRFADSTDRLEGDVEAAFPSGATTKGEFRAVWRSEQVFCG